MLHRTVTKALEYIGAVEKYREHAIALQGACAAMDAEDAPAAFSGVGNVSVKWAEEHGSTAQEAATKAASAVLAALQYYFDEYEPTRSHDDPEDERIVALRKAVRDLQNDMP